MNNPTENEVRSAAMHVLGIKVPKEVRLLGMEEQHSAMLCDALLVARYALDVLDGQVAATKEP